MATTTEEVKATKAIREQQMHDQEIKANNNQLLMDKAYTLKNCIEMGEQEAADAWKGGPKWSGEQLEALMGRLYDTLMAM